METLGPNNPFGVKSVAEIPMDVELCPLAGATVITEETEDSKQ